MNYTRKPVQLLVLLLLAWSIRLVLPPLHGQSTGQAVNISHSPNAQLYTHRYYYDGSGNLTHDCATVRNQITYTWLSSDSAITSIVDSSNTSTLTTAAAHGLAVGNQIIVTGATEDTDLNGTYLVATVPSTTTLTFTTASVTDDTYNESTLTVTTNAPRGNAPIWQIARYLYNGSNQLTDKQNSDFQVSCDGRASLKYE